MWYFGVLAGLFIGAITDSVPAALVFSVLGGIIVHLATRKKSAVEKTEIKYRSVPPQLIDLQRQIANLERRLKMVEAQLATTQAETQFAEGVPQPAIRSARAMKNLLKPPRAPKRLENPKPPQFNGNQRHNATPPRRVPHEASTSISTCPWSQGR